MIGIKGDFYELDAFLNELEGAIENAPERIIREWMNVGERYIAEGRASGTYKDQTGNLRNAHSYIIYKDGEKVAGVIGRPETLKMFEHMKVDDGIQLIVGDGMDYASYVEGKGYNVCTSGFMQTERETRNLRDNFKLG